MFNVVAGLSLRALKILGGSINSVSELRKQPTPSFRYRSTAEHLGGNNNTSII
jgi:hypothetical protein